MEISKILSIKIPDGGICLIDDNTDIELIEEELGYEDDIEGICFYSLKLEKSTPFVESNDVVKNIIKKVPNQWGVSETDLNSLIDYIIYRLNHIDKIVQLIVNYNS